MNKLILVFLFIVFHSLSYGTTQYYDSSLSSNVTTNFDITSCVLWGYIDIDYVELSKIRSNNDGYIEFSIEETDYVEVSLTLENNDNGRYGFIFTSNGVAKIQVSGVEVDLADISYSYSDLFKVQKCGATMRFFKNGEEIFQTCDFIPSDPLLHTTHVSNAVQTRLTLTFESEIDPCGAPTNTIQSISASSNINNSDASSRQNLASFGKLPENKIVVVNIFDSNESPLKQYKIRTTSTGELPAAHPMKKYLSKEYIIRIKY